MQQLYFHQDKNFFMDWLLFNELATSEIVLWHTLMNIGNRLGQRSVFNVPTSTMEIFTGLSNRAILDARKKLKERGFIDYDVGRMNRPPVYKMLPIHQTLKKHPFRESKENIEQKNRPQEMQQNLIYRTFEDNISKLTPIVRKELATWNHMFEDAIILEAIRITAMKGGKTYSYTNKILTEWHEQKLSTFDEIEAYELQKERTKMKSTIQVTDHKQSLEKELEELLEEEF